MKQKIIFYAWLAQLLVEGIISFFATIDILGEIKNASMSGNSKNSAANLIVPKMVQKDGSAIQLPGLCKA